MIVLNPQQRHLGSATGRRQPWDSPESGPQPGLGPGVLPSGQCLLLTSEGSHTPQKAPGVEGSATGGIRASPQALHMSFRGASRASGLERAVEFRVAFVSPGSQRTGRVPAACPGMQRHACMGTGSSQAQAPVVRTGALGSPDVCRWRQHLFLISGPVGPAGTHIFSLSLFLSLCPFKGFVIRAQDGVCRVHTLMYGCSSIWACCKYLPAHSVAVRPQSYGGSLRPTLPSHTVLCQM